MKVKCIVDEYFDREFEKYIKKDDIVDAPEKRAKVLIDKGFVEVVVPKEKPNKEIKDAK